MFTHFPFSQDDLPVILPILLTTGAFIGYWFTAHAAGIKAYFDRKYHFDEASFRHIFFTKVAGLIFFAVLPIGIWRAFFPDHTWTDLGLGLQGDKIGFAAAWALGLSLLVAPLAFVSAQKPKNLVNYPQVRAKTWTPRILTGYLLGWALYLFGYELLFRGLLLFPLAAALGVWPAIAINIALYALSHVPKGLEETLGSTLLGLVLCLLTLYAQTIWIAVIVHLVMAWANSLTALRYHPDMHFTGWKK